MSKNEENLIEIIGVLCDAVSDTPCGCDACAYVDSMVDEQCEVYDYISKVREGELLDGRICRSNDTEVKNV